MQRQSLGSPVSKLHGHGGSKEDLPIVHIDSVEDGDSKRKPLDLSASSTSSSAGRRLSYSQPSPLPASDRLIHAIPVLTLLCFLVLFLFSHSPSQSEMSQFKGFNWSAKQIDSSAENEIGGDALGRLTELRGSDVLAIRSLRNLHEIQSRAPKPRRHRKFADV